jgi:peptidyl-prolyl cis-trans isomerase B (cyclophilin B)
MDIIDRIVNVPRDKQDQPLSPISLRVEIKYLSKSEIAALLTASTDE